jgi:DNA-binding NarL/FixJ family response regulator
MIRLLIVDDHPVVRQGLEQLFATVPDVQVVGTAEDGNVAVAQARALTPDVILMDIGMPNCDGVDATRQIMDANPGNKIVILTAYGNESRILPALHAGALGYLHKHTAPEDVIKAVRGAHAGDPIPSPHVGGMLSDRRPERDAARPPEGGMSRVERTRGPVRARLDAVLGQVRTAARIQVAR